MKSIVSLLLSGLLLPTCLLAQKITIEADHTNALYRCGEPATFTVTAFGADQKPLTAGQMKLAIAPFTTQSWTRTSVDLAKSNPATIQGTLAEPGFIRCVATLMLGTNRVEKSWGVGFDPEKLTPGSERPADFDAYWDGEMARLEKEVPLNAEVKPLENWKNPKFEAFRVSFATFGGQRVYGFLAVPKAGTPPYRVRVNVPGAGSGVTGPSCEDRTITLVMNVHPYEMPLSKTDSKARYAEQDKTLNAVWHAGRYCCSGAASREQYFYHPIILGINRAVNWVAARPDVDLKDFTYFGTSQGGGFGYYLCGLNRHFTKGEMNVAAITDLSGYLKGRTSGWPRLVESQSIPANKASAEKIAPYFDAAHFAPRITCPVRVSVGFIDTTCPPCAVYSAYNALRVKDKAIANGLGMPHGVFGWIYTDFRAWRDQR